MTLPSQQNAQKPAVLPMHGVRPTAQAAVIPAGGATLLHFPQFGPDNIQAALAAVRGFRSTGGKVMWCDVCSEEFASPETLRGWGRRFVDEAQLCYLLVSGSGARAMAEGARERGLALGRVVVCRDESTARNLLCDSLSPGAVVLAAGIGLESCRQLVDRLEWKFEYAPAAHAKRIQEVGAA